MRNKETTKELFLLNEDFRKRHDLRRYTLTHMHILTQGLAVTAPEDVKNPGKCVRLGSCDQVEPKGNASCPLNRLILRRVESGFVPVLCFLDTINLLT